MQVGENRLPQPGRDWALFLDFDGTLVEIAETPESIVVDPSLGRLLDGVARYLDGALAVVSGRPIADIDRYLGSAVAAVAGLHGLERRTPDGHMHRSDSGADDIAAARERLQAFAATNINIHLEDKGLSLALHYRQAPEGASACEDIIRSLAAASDGRLEVQAGKMVYELKPVGGDKGDAVMAFMSAPPFAGRTPVFVGDDVTDEHGFAVVNDHDGISVVVGDRMPSAARWRIVDITALYAWLRTFREGERRIS